MPVRTLLFPHSEKPTLDLDFTESLDSRITFTRASTATFFDSAGVLQSAASGVSRIGAHLYDGANWENRGFLIEEARTNSALQSEDLSTTWTMQRGSVTTNQIVAPNGNTAADLLTEDGTAAQTHYLSQVVTVDNAVQHVWSIFVKAKERTIALLALQLDQSRGVFFDLSDGTMGTVGAAVDSSGIIDVGNGWFRIWIEITSISTTFNADISFTPADGTSSFNGDNSSGGYAWGGQVERAVEFLSSYIPTTTAAVTRAEDLASMALPAEYSQLEGTQYISGFSENDDVPVGSAQYPWFINDGDSDLENSIFMFRSSAEVFRFDVNDTNVAQVALEFAVSLSSGAFHLASAWKVNDFAATDEGSAVSTDTSGSVPAGQALTTLTLGNRVSGGRNMNAYIDRFSLWNRRLPNVRLQDKTI